MTLTFYYNFFNYFYNQIERISYFSCMKNENKNENCTILIPKGNSYCRRKSSARGPRFKSHPKDYQQKLTYYNGHPSKYKPGSMLLNPSVLGG